MTEKFNTALLKCRCHAKNAFIYVYFNKLLNISPIRSINDIFRLRKNFVKQMKISNLEFLGLETKDFSNILSLIIFYIIPRNSVKYSFLFTLIENTQMMIEF